MARKLKVAHIDRFILAGDAVFTVVRPAREVEGKLDPEVRFTYRVQRAEGEEETRPWFVKVLTGPNNLRDYQFVGTIFPHDAGEIEYRHSRKSRIGDDAQSVRGIVWLVEHLSAIRQLEAENASLFDASVQAGAAMALFRQDVIGDEVIPHVQALGRIEVWHEGRCGRCARRLTVPESILIGIGPECAEIMGLGALDKLVRAVASSPAFEPDPSSEPDYSEYMETPPGG